MLSQNVKKRVLSCIMDYIHHQGLKWNDDFPSEVSSVFVSFVQKDKTLPDIEAFLVKAKRIRTTFFRLNHGVRKEEFFRKLLKALNKKFKYIEREFEKKVEGRPTPTKIVVEVETRKPVYAKFISVDDVDSFAEVKKIERETVEKIIPLNIAESEIKRFLAEIIGETYTQRDWGGEKSDLFTTRLKIKGRRIPSAFLLKGSGTKGKLTIKKCGKNGDQILRLVDEPARLFIVQHIDEIDSAVTRLLEKLVSEKARGRQKLYYCIIDGLDTARIFMAYGKMNARKL